KNVTHGEHINFWNRIFEKVSGGKSKPVVQGMRADVAIEDRLNRGQVETNSLDVTVVQSNLDRHRTLGATNIGKCFVIVPWKFLGNGFRGGKADPGHSSEEGFHFIGITVKCFEAGQSVLAFVLRLTGPQGFGERTPERIESGVRHFKHATDVAGFFSIEKAISFRAVLVNLFVAIKNAKRHQRF